MSLSKIFFWVLFAHVLILSVLYLQKSRVFVSPKKITVSTIVFKKPEKVLEKVNFKTTVLKKEIKKEKKIIEKENKPKALEVKKTNNEIKKTNNNVVKEIKKSVKIEKNKNILKKDLNDEIKILENFSAATNENSKKELFVPKIGDLQVPTIDIVKDDSEDQSIQNVLVEYFKQNLSLPEYGEVKIKLTLNSDGTIVDVCVVSSKSKKNEEYLKNTLPNLAFPWFNQYLPNEKKLVLTISFLNEK